MDIHIDTNKDSKEEIRRVIRMLQAYVGESVTSSSQYPDSQSSDSAMPDATPGMFGMFNDGDSSTTNDTMPYSETKEDQEDKKEPRIQIIDY